MTMRETLIAQLTAAGLSHDDALAVFVALARSADYADNPDLWERDAAALSDEARHVIRGHAAWHAVALMDRHGGRHWARGIFQRTARAP